MCVLFWGAHKSLAPRARTLLGGLGQATLSFFAVATLLFSVFVSVLNFGTSPNSGVKLLGGFLRSEKTIFRFIFSACASFSWFFFFFCCDRAGKAKSVSIDLSATPHVVSWEGSAAVTCAPEVQSTCGEIMNRYSDYSLHIVCFDY